MFSDILEVRACADLNKMAAEKRAAQFGIIQMGVDELLADPEIEVVLNLTVPEAHYDIAKKALLAGKHTYSEKPIATRFSEGEELIALARGAGLFCTAAPDTFLGGGLQTCRRLIDDGRIGTPINLQCFMLSWGPERFHPSPEFLYQEGAGPLFDMGPYYLTALISLFGPVRKVTGHAKKTNSVREVLVENSPQFGESFPCNIDTFVSAILEFESGLTANMNVSWDLSFSYWESGLPLMQLFGSLGSLIMPDPNTFGGVGSTPRGDIGKYIKLRTGADEFEDVPLISGHIGNCRGLGLADMAMCIRKGGTPLVSGEGALHVLEIMHGVLMSSGSGSQYTMKTTYSCPPPLSEELR